MKPTVNLIKLGRMTYVKALDVQQHLFKQLKDSITSSAQCSKTYPNAESSLNVTRFHPDRSSASLLSSCPIATDIESLDARNSLILVEHEPVYTIGIRCKDYDDKYVIKLEQTLADHNQSAEFVKTSRGGLITFHGPGQLVAYPILYLGDFDHSIKHKSLKFYIKLLEKSIIETLSMIGVDGAHTVDEYPGVWLDRGERKIAFIGVNCKRYVTMHGLSINYDCDLSWFDHIVSCGIKDKKITSVHEELTRHGYSSNRPLNRHSDNHLYTNRSKLLTSHTSSGIENNSESNIDTLAYALCISFSRNFQCTLKPIEKYYKDFKNYEKNSS